MKTRLVSLAPVALWAFACGIPPEPLSTRPDVLLIVLDTTRADALSCYGHPQATTPRIDRLAATGTRFEWAYSTSFWTLPAHASLFTGLTPSAAGATSETNHLPPANRTLAERLGEAGYRTGAVVRNGWLSRERGFAQGFDDFDEAWRTEPGRGVEAESAAVDRAVEWIEAAGREEQPFFLFLNLNIAHLPYDPGEDLRARFLERPWPLARVRRLMEIVGGWDQLAGPQPLDGDDLEILSQLYAAEVSIADAFVGRLLDALEAGGTLDRTLVIVTSDHGEHLGEHGLIDHVLSFYEPAVRIPLILRHPTSFAGGEVRHDLASLVDIAPTIAELAGIESPADAPGRSLLSTAAEVAVFAENDRPLNGLELLARRFPELDRERFDHRMRMIRTGDHKLIWRPDVSAELYDVGSDPGETQDRSDADPARRDALLARLRAHEAGRSGLLPERFRESDDRARERLRALGYVD